MNDSQTLRAALVVVEGILRAQEAKGREKYRTDLDGAGLSAAQLLTHATEEAADLLMYLTALKAHIGVDQEIARDWEACYRGACADRGVLLARVAELEAENAQARSLLADLRRGYLPDGAARAVEAAADAFLAGEPVEGTLADALARVEVLEEENAALRERLDYYGGFADPNNAQGPPDFQHPSPYRTTEGEDE